MSVRAEVAQHCPDGDLDLIRELLSFDSLCPVSTTFVRDELGQLQYAVPPSPLHWSRQVEWPWILRNGDFGPTDWVLDVGAGWSCLKFALNRRCRRVVCLEKEQEYIRKAQAAVGRILKPGAIDFICGDVRSINLPDAFFDKVVCCSVVEHMTGGHADACREMVRVLKPGGKLLLTMDVRINDPEGDYGDFHLGMKEAGEVFAALGCAPVVCPSPLLGSRQMGGRVEIVVVMVEYTKE